ncbi:hypothetical protein AGLY_008269 [Aphis glycines]|uniref:Uncharacterized protein n=1 Tax=Aphis glycines TaxID=307491 RepID=A0A6G0TLX5_APHGL|nr:hypothetical protein AGLY_008269 [Aphis glycines]
MSVMTDDLVTTNKLSDFFIHQVLNIQTLSSRRSIAGINFVSSLLNGTIDAPTFLSSIQFRVSSCPTRDHTPIYVPSHFSSYGYNHPMYRMLRTIILRRYCLIRGHRLGNIQQKPYEICILRNQFCDVSFTIRYSLTHLNNKYDNKPSKNYCDDFDVVLAESLIQRDTSCLNILVVTIFLFHIMNTYKSNFEGVLNYNLKVFELYDEIRTLGYLVYTVLLIDNLKIYKTDLVKTNFFDHDMMFLKNDKTLEYHSKKLAFKKIFLLTTRDVYHTITYLIKKKATRDVDPLYNCSKTKSEWDMNIIYIYTCAEYRYSLVIMPVRFIKIHRVKKGCVIFDPKVYKSLMEGKISAVSAICSYSKA